MKKIFALIVPLLLSGCGHTMYHKVEGTGLYGRIPLPNGNSLVEVAFGDMNITSGILRGGAILDENTSKGGTFGTVSIGRHTTLTTVPALNEGNIRDVLTSPNTDDKTKQLIAEYLISRPQPPPPSSSVTSVNSGAATGDKNSIPEVKATKTGLDNVVDRVAEVTPQVVEPIASNTKEVINHVSDNIESGTTKVVNNFWNQTRTIIISVIAIIIIALFAGFIFFLKRRKKQKSQNQNANIITEEQKPN